MTRIGIPCVLATLVGCCSVNAFAGEESNFYVGAQYGAIHLTSQDSVDFSSPKNAGFNVGYRFSESWAVEGQYSSSLTDGVGTGGVAQDVTAQMSDFLNANGMGSADPLQAVTNATLMVVQKERVSVDSLGLFGVYRTSGPLYAKIKAGVTSLKTSVEVKANAASISVLRRVGGSESVPASQLGINLTDYDSSSSETQTHFSAGVGVGYKISDKVFAELEYVKFNSDVSSYSLSLNYAF